MNMLWLLLVLYSMLLSACSSIFSGDTPQPVVEDDRNQVMHVAFALYGVPSMTARLSDTPFKVYIVAFDGTENDRDHVDSAVEKKTMVAALAEELKENKYNVDYTIGPGVGSKVDAAICSTCIPKAQKALVTLRNKIDDEWSKTPNLEVRVLVMGFSRGAAIGRHFMNLVSDTWPLSNVTGKPARVVRTVGLLFDTVATGKEDTLRLGIAPTTDYVIHLLARDERRGLFRAVIDNDLDFIVRSQGELRYSDRMSEITLPGVHSDIGGSYLDGLGTAYRVLSERILVELGLLQTNSWALSDAVFNHGAHDSRGSFDKVLGVRSVLEAPDEQREIVRKESSHLSSDQREVLMSRLNGLRMAKWNDSPVRGASITWRTLATSRFVVIKHGEDLRVTTASNWIRPQTLAFESSNGQRRLAFGGLDVGGRIAMSSIRISDDVWNAIPENIETTLEVVILKPGNQQMFMYFLVNRRQIERLEAISN